MLEPHCGTLAPCCFCTDFAMHLVHTATTSGQYSTVITSHLVSKKLFFNLSCIIRVNFFLKGCTSICLLQTAITFSFSSFTHTWSLTFCGKVKVTYYNLFCHYPDGSSSNAKWIGFCPLLLNSNVLYDMPSTVVAGKT